MVRSQALPILRFSQDGKDVINLLLYGTEMILLSAIHEKG